MAVSQIEEKILGRLAHQVEPVNPLLSSALYQILGLSILLSRKLFRARRVRRLDVTRETKSLQLYHHIIWLAREGLSIAEVYVLPHCQNDKYGSECRVMAAKLRASFFHIFCLFHNSPPISTKTGGSPASNSPPSSSKTTKIQRLSPNRTGQSAKAAGKLRDPIPSMTSETSYVTNPFGGASKTPPPALPVPVSLDFNRRTPTRPPGLDVLSPSSLGAFLLPPMNFVPTTKEHFDTAQGLANALLIPTHALRLSVCLEHAAFAWDCEKNQERARQLARRTIKEVYASTDGLDDDEFADAATLVQTLAGLLRRGSNSNTPRKTADKIAMTRVTASDPQESPLRIDRTIAISPMEDRARRTDINATLARESIMQSPERLSTVQENESATSETMPPELSTIASAPPTSTAITSPLISRRSSRRRSSSTASDKASKRRLVEQAEEAYRRRGSNASRTSTLSPISVRGKIETIQHGDSRSIRQQSSATSLGSTALVQNARIENVGARPPRPAARPPRSPVTPSMSVTTRSRVSPNIVQIGRGPTSTRAGAALVTSSVDGAAESSNISPAAIASGPEGNVEIRSSPRTKSNKGSATAVKQGSSSSSPSSVGTATIPSRARRSAR